MTSRPTVIAIGEMLSEFVSLRTGCGLERIGGFEGPFPSGAPAIFIDQAARTGAAARMIGGVGADGFGRGLLARLARSDVVTEWVTVDATRATGVAFVSYFEDGSRTFIFHIAGTAADAFALPHDLATVVAAAPDAVLHVSGSSLGNPAIRVLTERAAETVLAAGGRLSIDPNVRRELFADPAVSAALRAMIARSAIVLPSLEDLDALFPGLEHEVAVGRLLEAGAEVVALKRAHRGCRVTDGTEVVDLPGHRMDVVDPTGAGDCFCGTFVALLAAGAPLAVAARYANAAGALSVTRRGPMEGNSDRDEIERFLATASDEPASVPGTAPPGQPS